MGVVAGHVEMGKGVLRNRVNRCRQVIKQFRKGTNKVTEAVDVKKLLKDVICFGLVAAWDA